MPRGIRNAAARAIVLEHLRAGGTVTEAAKLAGVTRQTVYNWRKRDKGDVEISAALPGAQAAAKAKARRGRADDLRKAAADALKGIAEDGDARDADRVQAAKALLQYVKPAGAQPEALEGPPPEPEEKRDDEEQGGDPTARFRVVS